MVGCLAFQPVQKGGGRGIACIDVTVNSPFPFQEQLFGQIQNEALRNSALHYYLFLDQVEARALSSRAGVMSSYGVSDFQFSPASLFAPQSIVNFDPSVNAFASGHLWGDLSILGRQSQTSSSLQTNALNPSILGGPMVNNLPSLRTQIPKSNFIGAGLPLGHKTQNPSFIQIGSR